MNLEDLERREALLSAIQEQQLLIHEYRATEAFLVHERAERESVLAKRYGQLILYRLKEMRLRRMGWLMEALNAHEHNLCFYQERLDTLISEE